MATAHNDLENRLWAAADQLLTNSSLRPSEYSGPVLGLIFLRFADVRFAHAKAVIEQQTPNPSHRRTVGKVDYEAAGVLYLPNDARFDKILASPEGTDMGLTLDAVMRAIEEENKDLGDTLPKSYSAIDNSTLRELLRIVASIPMDIEGDVFGKIYEYFLGKLARKEIQKGGEFFTPTSLVRVIVSVIEPFHGRILDPACGSGGMFIQSARFVAEHQRDPTKEISIYGQEKVGQTLRIAKMNLAVHGLAGDIKEGNTYYEDLHESVGKFEYVMANPQFNASGVDEGRLKGDLRFPFGIPTVDNANYLWIQIFYSALNEHGRAGFVMANSAADARGSEAAIRQRLIAIGAVDAMISVSPNFFDTVTLPCTLWFLDRAKGTGERAGTTLFIDARKVFTQVDRAHREFSKAQLEFIANIARLERGEAPEFRLGSQTLVEEHFPEGIYQDIPGLCRVATINEIQDQGWSLNPGRYVGVADREGDGFDFRERLEWLNEELEQLNIEAHELEDRIGKNVRIVLNGSGVPRGF